MRPALFRAAFILLFCGLSALRLLFRIKAGLLRPYAEGEPPGFIVARTLLGLPLAAGTAAYCFFPGAWPWAYLPVPEWLRLGGAALGCAALLLLLRVHLALGPGFSTGPGPRQAQRLVTDGPYAWLRHPMYAAYFLLFLGAFALSQSWLIGCAGSGVILLLATLRRRYEERLLAARFGAAYERYQRCTAAFLPRPPRVPSRRVRPQPRP